MNNPLSGLPSSLLSQAAGTVREGVQQLHNALTTGNEVAATAAAQALAMRVGQPIARVVEEVHAKGANAVATLARNSPNKKDQEEARNASLQPFATPGFTPEGSRQIGVPSVATNPQRFNLTSWSQPVAIRMSVEAFLAAAQMRGIGQSELTRYNSLSVAGNNSLGAGGGATAVAIAQTGLTGITRLNGNGPGALGVALHSNSMIGILAEVGTPDTAAATAIDLNWAWQERNGFVRPQTAAGATAGQGGADIIGIPVPGQVARLVLVGCDLISGAGVMTPPYTSTSANPSTVGASTGTENDRFMNVNLLSAPAGSTLSVTYLNPGFYDYGGVINDLIAGGIAGLFPALLGPGRN